MCTSLTMKPKKPMTKKPTLVASAIFRNSLASGLVQRLTSRMLSAPNCLMGWTSAWKLLAGITSPSVVALATFLGMAESRRGGRAVRKGEGEVTGG